MSSQYATSYGNNSPPPIYESTVENTPSNEGAIDRRYIKGIPGLLKLLEVVFTLIAFICVTVSIYICVPFVATAGYFKFISMACCITSVLHYFILLLKLQHRIFRCKCVFWPLVEVSYYIGLLIMLFFGDLFLSLHACDSAQKAGVAFGWFAFFPYCIDGALAIRLFLQARKERTSSQESGTSTAVTTDSRY